MTERNKVKVTYHKGQWTIDIIEFERTFDVQVWPDPENPASNDWVYASVGWPSEKAAHQKALLWIELKEAEENFRNFN